MDDMTDLYNQLAAYSFPARPMVPPLELKETQKPTQQPTHNPQRRVSETFTSPPTSPRPIVSMCSYCRRMSNDATNGASGTPSSAHQPRWMTEEEFFENGGSENVLVSHGACHTCFDHVDKIIDGPSSSPLPAPIHHHHHHHHRQKATSPVKDLVTANRGFVSLQNDLTSGGSEEELDASHSSATRVLVVDDDGLQRMIIKKLLAKAGLTCDLAGSGSEAIEMIKSKTKRNGVKNRPYAMVFMDCLMPELNGFDTAEIIRQMDDEVPIIAVTGLTNDDDLKTKCKQSGINDIINKPVKLNYFLGAAQKWLNCSAGTV